MTAGLQGLAVPTRAVVTHHFSQAIQRTLDIDSTPSAQLAVTLLPVSAFAQLVLLFCLDAKCLAIGLVACNVFFYIAHISSAQFESEVRMFFCDDRINDPTSIGGKESGDFGCKRKAQLWQSTK